MRQLAREGSLYIYVDNPHLIESTMGIVPQSPVRLTRQADLEIRMAYCLDQGQVLAQTTLGFAAYPKWSLDLLVASGFFVIKSKKLLAIRSKRGRVFLVGWPMAIPIGSTSHYYGTQEEPRRIPTSDFLNLFVDNETKLLSRYSSS